MKSEEIERQLEKINPYSETGGWCDSVKLIAAKTLSEFELRPEQVKVLAIACDATERYHKAKEDIAAKGMTFVTQRGEVRKNPTIDIEREARRDAVRFFRELNLEGVNPEGRKPRIGGDYM